MDRETEELSLRCLTAADVTAGKKSGLGDWKNRKWISWTTSSRSALKSRENGGAALLDWLEQTVSGFFRIGDRTAVSYTGIRSRRRTAFSIRMSIRLPISRGNPQIRDAFTPLRLRAAATKFGEGMATGEAAGDEEKWVRVPGMKLTPEMFVARVVGRSMEPLIPDDSLCVFRTGVTGSRKGRYLLIERVR